jgi:hypothetical protein
MDLWIRGQDRDVLASAKGLYISDNYEVIKSYPKEVKEYLNSTIENNEYRFGSYKSKERALEVLDEIQKKIEETFWDYSKDDYCIKSVTNIYQMPID